MRAKKTLCAQDGPLISGSLFKLSFFPRGNFFWFWEGGWFGLGGGGGRQTPPLPPPMDKHIPGLCHVVRPPPPHTVRVMHKFRRAHRRRLYSRHDPTGLAASVRLDWSRQGMSGFHFRGGGGSIEPPKTGGGGGGSGKGLN